MDIKQLREHERLTQSQLALKVGVSTGYISHLETGKRVNGYASPSRSTKRDGKRPAGSTVRLTIKHEEVRLC